MSDEYSICDRCGKVYEKDAECLHCKCVWCSKTLTMEDKDVLCPACNAEYERREEENKREYDEMRARVQAGESVKCPQCGKSLEISEDCDCEFPCVGRYARHEPYCLYGALVCVNERCDWPF